MKLCIYTETIVKSFEKYHKYTIGTDLRNLTKELLFLIHRTNISKDKSKLLESLRNRCEDLKMLINLTKELKAFKSFKQFENISKIAVEVCKQSQGWLNSNSARILK